ncbi:Annexin [Plakobranchus ocellatus]|uniref:Annexin n=1 Tax=Plakobranchus ocellatus TaxID=259542 RepID=A0AAV4BIZ6_9GAST|nr:Annexin [Plakobranchus ocellatus]
MVGTIRFRDEFSAGDVASTLRDAMGGIGTDEDAVINVMGNHCLAQRLEIAEAYKTAYGKDLIEDIKSELSGDFEDTVVALLTPMRKLEAQQLHGAISGAGTDEETIIEVLATKTNEEIEEIKEAYKEEYENELEQDLCSDTSGYFRRLLVSLLTAGREPEGDVDYDRAVDDAKKFFEAGEARWGTEEAELNAVLCLRSRSQLLETFYQFEKLADKPIEESIKDECSGDLQDGYLAIVESTKSMPGFFAHRINKSVRGLGTDDNNLIRIIITRSEIDMEEIDAAYREKYEQSLEEVIESECGGDYKKILIAVVRMQE